MKTLYLLRGIPGSGKTTLAMELVYHMCEEVVQFAADQYYEIMNTSFDSRLLKKAHEWCQTSVEEAMKLGIENVLVHNTFVRQWEMDPYLEMAEEYGYKVVSLIVENRHGNKSIHNVPEQTIDKMRSNFEVKL